MADTINKIITPPLPVERPPEHRGEGNRKGKDRSKKKSISETDKERQPPASDPLEEGEDDKGKHLDIKV
ncbi:MAG: hypothetical protein IH857_02900 [Deltaproteobacteria bacterium]|nr:hypothetical protein [Deltaproteobacteria bacterium]